ncbi:MAG: hypothetical protein ACRDRL_16625, partial [Sciscionella sp.]
MPGPRLCVAAPEMSGHAIYQAMRVNVPGPGSLHDAASSAEDAHRELQNAEQALRGYQSCIAAGIQGGSGDAAHQAATPMISAAMQSQHSVQGFGSQCRNQAGQFNDRSAKLHDIPENPPDASFGNRLMSGFGLWGTDPATEKDNYNNADAANKMQYQGYAQDSFDHYQAIPSDDGKKIKTLD